MKSRKEKSIIDLPLIKRVDINELRGLRVKRIYKIESNLYLVEVKFRELKS